MSKNGDLAVSDADGAALAGPAVSAPRSRRVGRVVVGTSGWVHEKIATALYRRVAQGDQEAFSHLYDRIAPIVLGMLTGNRTAQPEVVMSSALMHLWKTAPTLAAQNLRMTQKLGIAIAHVTRTMPVRQLGCRAVFGQRIWWFLLRCQGWLLIAIVDFVGASVAEG
ncbi:hypothetical protein [Subtercola sp. RTI3]|uniref:hypothetical protein n=1 Tax=Subtercola sp. RTI3 TaxID=3048639 RepID=UPI002B236B07|nr:hypothetical protein [Subtercola sp. RTI3]MEA9985978.1 hypothetical protein [Subtercola sp. RTI3]